MSGEDIKTKVCSKCGKELPMTEKYFNRNKRSKDGFSYYCKECLAIIRQKHKEKTRDYFRQYRATHRAKFKEYNKRYYLKRKGNNSCTSSKKCCASYKPYSDQCNEIYEIFGLPTLNQFTDEIINKFNQGGK